MSSCSGNANNTSKAPSVKRERVNSDNCSTNAPTVNSGNNIIPKESTVDCGENYLLMIVVLMHPLLVVTDKIKS